MKKNKKNISGIITCCIILFIIFAHHIQNSSKMRLEINKIKGGYGYQIKEEDRVLIDQPVIPAISEEKPFKSREDAKKVGELVLQRVKNHTDFSVTVSELRELNIE